MTTHVRRYLAVGSIALFMSGNNVRAVDIDFFTDGIIQTSDVYNRVQLHGTSHVDMTGAVNEFALFDTSSVDIYGGAITLLESRGDNVNNGNIMTLHAGNVTDVIVNFESELSVFGGTIVNRLSILKNSVIRLSGGSLNWISFDAGNNATVHVYGTNLSSAPYGGAFGKGFISGNWPNNDPFHIDLIGLTVEDDNLSRIILHEIPEPTTLILLSLGSLLLLKRIVIKSAAPLE